jgi:hypothetical protein
MSQAILIVAAAFRQANLDQTLISFNPSQEFPYNCGQDLINTVLQEMNRLANFGFTQTRTGLPYGVGVYQYALTNSFIDPKRIIAVRKELTRQSLKPMNWSQFQKRFRSAPIATGEPIAWAKFGNTLELSHIPDKDYTLSVQHYTDMPLITSGTQTLLLAESDEDVIRDGVYAYLLQRMGRDDFSTAYQLYRDKLTLLIQNQKADASLAQQMPAAF